MYYIQMKNRFSGLETVDEFPTYREACKMVREYRMADNQSDYYISSRACHEWRESGKSDIKQGANHE